MYSHLVAAATGYPITALIKGEGSYDFFTYRGPKIDLDYRGKSVPLSKGDRFGVRKSANGKSIRFVFENELTRVFTLDLDTAKKIAKGIKE